MITSHLHPRRSKLDMAVMTYKSAQSVELLSYAMTVLALGLQSQLGATNSIVSQNIQ